MAGPREAQPGGPLNGLLVLLPRVGSQQLFQPVRGSRGQEEETLIRANRIKRKELSDADGYQQITGHAFAAAGISTS